MTRSQWLKGFIAYPPTRLSAAIVALTILGFFVSLALWVPAKTNLRRVQTELQALEKRSGRMQAEAELARAVMARSAVLMELRQKLEAGANQADQMGHIQELAEVCGIRILEHKSVESDREHHDTERHLISAAGDYAGIRRFLSELAPTVPRLTIIRSARLERGANDNSVRAELELISYLKSGEER